MSKFLSEVKGFTPVIDILAKRLGVITALVYGIIWRYCQMEDGICKASRERIANHAGISVKTVERHLEKLCQHGYLRDMTPDRRNAPHDYADTGKAKIIGLLTAEMGDENIGTTESRTRCDRESNPGTTESLMMKERESKETPGGKSALDWTDLCRATEQARQREGQWTVTPSQGGNGLVTVAIKCIYEHLDSTPPEPGSGTWIKLCQMIEPVLADYRIKSEAVIKQGVALFHKEQPTTFDPWYKSFPGQLGVYLGKANNGGQPKVLKVGH